MSVSVFKSVCTSDCLCVSLSLSHCVILSVCKPVRASVCLCVSLSVCQSVYVSVSVCVSVCLCVSLSVTYFQASDRLRYYAIFKRLNELEDVNLNKAILPAILELG